MHNADPETARLQAAIEQARVIFDDLKIQLNNHKAALAGIAVGNKVRSTVLNRHGAEGIVSRIDAAFSKPWVYVRIIKKDGTLQTRDTCFYGDWEKVA